MTSKIKVDNINKVSDDSNIINKCGTNITMGQNGDTVILPNGVTEQVQSGGAIQVQSGGSLTIASGATITNNGTAVGLGRTGTVNWDTTPKTGTFTAVSGVGYFADTSSTAFTMNLPAGVAGAIVSVADYTRTFQTNNLTITPDGSEKIGGVAASFVAQTEGQSITLVYVDGTEGWINTAESTGESGLVAAFICASSPCVATVGDYKIHTFTGPGTFTVACAGNVLGSNSVDYLVVAGAGGGGGDAGGGGGAGGFRLSNSTCMPSPQTSPLATSTALPVTVQGYPIVIGGGGAGHSAPASPPAQKGQAGNPSTFSTIVSTAGGGGGQSSAPSGNADPGGSGGGGRGSGALGNGNTPPVSPPQGNDGGDGSGGGGGGGGAAAVGSTVIAPDPGGPGGAGSFVVQTGFAGCNGAPGPVSGGRYFAGGGAGAADQCGQGGGTGGVGGGGPGQSRPASGNGTNGLANTGGGGGGGGVPSPSSNGGTGGSGIVIIRYKFQ